MNVRNPFRIRLSEHIESDATFLRLFSPGVLEILTEESLYGQIQIFRSAPGGGKTSLLRAFTPSVLLALCEAKSNDDYRELYRRMKELDVISEEGPELLGITLSCALNYANLQDLDFDPSRKKRLFFSLLNARLILALLRGASTLKNLNYPDELDRLNLGAFNFAEIPPQFPVPGSGRQLFNWARSVEERVCNIIDSFDPTIHDHLEGHDTLYTLASIRPEYIKCDGGIVAKKLLIMFDDVHKLSVCQRKEFLSTLFGLRPSIGIWIAERLEALNPDELIMSGAKIGREYELEDFWRLNKNSSKFEKTITNIADRRIQAVEAVPVGSFEGCLSNSLDTSERKKDFDKLIDAISSRIQEKAKTTERYKDWISSREQYNGPPYEKTIVWRSLEIMIERDVKNSQLVFDFVLPPEQLERDESAAVKSAAQFLISQDPSNIPIPYYFGIQRLITLSSSNIEQFLAFAEELFEEIVSAVILKKPFILSPERQEAILKRYFKQRWDELPRSIPNGRDVRKLLEAFGSLALLETHRPTAPYAPGVTGIALSMGDREKLINLQTSQSRPEYRHLCSILGTCISHNLLEVSLDNRQGQKTWMVLYLNRWLCLHFGLPLQYGGWRPQTPAELCRWLEQGFQPRKRI